MFCTIKYFPFSFMGLTHNPRARRIATNAKRGRHPHTRLYKEKNETEREKE